MSALLLDSHVLYWLVSGAEPLKESASYAIAEAQVAETLYVSPITAWELTIAAGKPAHRDPPNLGERTPGRWFSEAVALVGARIVPIRQQIALAAAAAVTDTGHKDPGDCYLIGTARARRMPIVSRDRVMHDLAATGYVQVIDC